MRATPLIASALLCVSACALTQDVQAAPRVHFELATEAGFPLNGARRWSTLFADMDQTRVRIRSAQPGDREAVAQRGTEQSPSYHVVGILSHDNRLWLPGRKRFTLNDRAAIRQWIETLQQDGIQGLTAHRMAFGLTSHELVAFHERLAKPVTFKTLDVRAGDTTRRIVQGLALEFEVTNTARAAFGRNEPVMDELRGVTCGTALAAVLRPLGLVAAPRKQRAQIRLIIGDVREVPESWPVGWPRPDSPYNVAPVLFEYLTVEVTDQPLSDVLGAIQGRVKLPFLYDHNSMARHRIDPDQALVSFPEKRTSYKRALDIVLSQARLRCEIRVDEAGTPLLWITNSR